MKASATPAETRGSRSKANRICFFDDWIASGTSAARDGPFSRAGNSDASPAKPMESPASADPLADAAPEGAGA